MVQNIPFLHSIIIMQPLMPSAEAIRLVPTQYDEANLKNDKNRPKNTR